MAEAPGLCVNSEYIACTVCMCGSVIVIADRFKYLSTQLHSHCSVGLGGQSRCAPKLGDNKAHNLPGK